MNTKDIREQQKREMGLETVYIGEKSGVLGNDENSIRRWLKREQEKGKPAWFDGSCLYMTAGKHTIHYDNKGRPFLSRLHELSEDGMFRHFEPCEYVAYNQAALDRFEEYQERDRQRNEKIKQKELEEKRRHERELNKIRSLERAIDTYIDDRVVKGKRGKVRLFFPWENTGEQWKEIDGTIFEGVLAVHRRNSGWSVTHVPTGMSMTGSSTTFRTQKDAKRYVFGILNLCDWHFDKDHVSEVIYRPCRLLVAYCSGESLSVDKLSSLMVLLHSIKGDLNDE